VELNYNKLIIKQKIESLEMFTGLETKNKYQILNESGTEVLLAYEQSHWFARIILKKMRKLSLTFIDSSKNTFLRVEKKFAFFFPEFEIFDSKNINIGKVKTRFGLTSKIEIYNGDSTLIFYCKNQMMHPWIFNIFKNKTSDKSLGMISKKWSGFGKEAFTDADNFIINFNLITDENEKKRILALSLIIDLYVFEKK
jgi:uncharacterized protein YxjI